MTTTLGENAQSARAWCRALSSTCVAWCLTLLLLLLLLLRARTHARPDARAQTDDAARPRTTTTRTFAQVQQLQQRLVDALPLALIPTAPEAPNPAMVHEPMHAEKKRRQVERFLQRLVARTDLATHPDVVAFTSEQATVRPRRTCQAARALAWTAR